jgi:hypothetical protein
MKQDFQNALELRDKVIENKSLKRDFIDDIRAIHMSSGEDGNYINLSSRAYDPMSVDKHALAQMGSWAKIPYNYIRTMDDNRRYDLLAENFNSWFKNPVNDSRTRKMFRGLASKSRTEDWIGSEKINIRSFHSDRYSVFDHEDVWDVVQPAIEELEKDFELKSSSITDSKMYIKLLFPEVEGKVVGDTVQLGLSITNSEIGLGIISVQPLIYVLRCTNGMVLPASGIKKRHIGSVLEEDGLIEYKEDTRKIAKEFHGKKTRDSIKSVVDGLFNGEILRSLNESASSKSVNNPQKAIEKITELFSLDKKESEGTTLAFWKERNLSKWGMANAVTEIANTHSSYDRASELEAIGGKIINMDEGQWSKIALAA